MITFPDSPPNGTEIIDRQNDGSVIIWVYDESKNEWTYQQYGNQDPIRVFTDEVLVRDNHSEIPGVALADPAELKTQKDVNYFLDELTRAGVTVSEERPDPPHHEGQLWFCSKEKDLTLYVYDGAEFVPAAPPVSLDGIETNADAILELQMAINRVDNTTAQLQSGLTNTVIKTDEALNEITESLGNVTLEEAVDNGNIARKPIAIETENGVSVVEDQCLRITHVENPYIRLTDVVDQDSLEITLDEDHGHINLTDNKDELHFKFGGVEKVVFKGEGDAEFKGRVTVDPGREGHEAVTFQQLAEVEQAIDDLAPSIERGEWKYAKRSDPHNGEYSLYGFTGTDSYCQAKYLECMATNDTVEGKSQCGRDLTECQEGEVESVFDNWALCDYFSISTSDAEGHNHPFPSDLVKPGQEVEILNIDGDGYGHYEIIGPIGNSQGKTRSWTVKHLNSKGVPNGLGAIRFFVAPIGRDEVYTKEEIDALLGGSDDEDSGGNEPELDTELDYGYKARPAQYAWKHKSTSSKKPPAGYMYMNGINYSNKGELLYFNPKPYDGAMLRFPANKTLIDHSGTSTSPDSSTLGKWIKYIQGGEWNGSWQMEAGAGVRSIKTDEDGILIVELGKNGWGGAGMEQGVQYFTIGGFF